MPPSFQRLLVLAITELAGQFFLWNQGNWAAGCCPIRRWGHISAKNLMYLRLEVKYPFISGKAATPPARSPRSSKSSTERGSCAGPDILGQECTNVTQIGQAAF